jgi:hypothetical protein
VVHPPFDRSHRHVEQRRDLVVLERRHVPEHEHEALRGGQTVQDAMNPAQGVSRLDVDVGDSGCPAQL